MRAPPDHEREEKVVEGVEMRVRLVPRRVTFKGREEASVALPDTMNGVEVALKGENSTLPPTRRYVVSLVLCRSQISFKK